MSDSKLKSDFSGAVRTLGRRTASGLRGILSRMRLWQKVGLLLCIFSWIASSVLGAVCARITGQMQDQTGAVRWMPDGGTAQISGFFSDGAAFSEDTVKAIQGILMNKLLQDAIGLSETQSANGAKLIDLCYSGIGTAELVRDDSSITATAIGVGGDFFNFHPLKMMSGYYFSEDDLMKDRVLLDDNTAWRLFGSPYVVGESIRIGGAPHLIAGVFKRPEGRFYKSAGMGDYLIFTSYDTLCLYTETGVPAAGEEGKDSSSEDDDSSMIDAMLPGTFRIQAEDRLPAAVSAIPSTAGYMPERRLLGVSSAADDGMDPSGKGTGSGGDEYTPLTTGGTNVDKDSDGDDGSGKEQVNRNRITCCEAFLPDPVSGFALRRFRSALSDAGIPLDQSSVVDNSARFGMIRLVSMLAQPGVRSMQTAAIRYPYWENVALAWEDVLIPVAFFRLFLRWWPFVFLLYLVLWYAINKSWTAGDIVRSIQDRIYERQSERIYGKRPAAALTDGSPAVRLPDSGHAAPASGSDKGLPAGQAESHPDGAQSSPLPGAEEVPPAGQAEKPSDGAQSSPLSGTEEVPPAGQAEKPSDGAQSKPLSGAEEAPPAGQAEKPSDGAQSKPLSGAEEVPPAGQAEKPSDGAQSKPLSGAEEAPPAGQAEKPSDGA